MADEADDQIDALNHTVLRTQAMYFALESLCLAMVESLPNKPDVLARFHAHTKALDVRTLFDGEVSDEVVHEIAQAHAKIAALISTAG